MKTVSIIGDSYSTYAGWVPEGYAAWYADGGNEAENDLQCVEQTWWHSLCAKYGLELVTNGSFSGTTVCHTGYNGMDYSNISFVARLEKDFGADCREPDILLIFGGTNDHWAGVPLGQLQYADWTQEQLYSFAPAFCKMLDHFTRRFPNTKIYNLLNDFIYDETMRKLIYDACEHYGVPVIAFGDVPKDNGHPNQAGMAAIREQIAQRLKCDGVL